MKVETHSFTDWFSIIELIKASKIDYPHSNEEDINKEAVKRLKRIKKFNNKNGVLC